MDEKISKLFLPILDKLYNTEPAGEPFRKPVDPIKYACYDYYVFVEHPIDLSTIRQKLLNHEYEGDAWRFIADIELMLANAFAFNKKGTTVYEFTTRLSKIWYAEISSIMQRMNYCCGNIHKFGPQLLFCHGTTPDKYCQIAIGAKYKCYQDSYSFCIPCFNRIRTEYISLQTLTCETSRMNLPTQPVKKSDFIDCTNDRWQYEAFIKCTQCSRRLHQICELYPAHEDEIKKCPQHEQIEDEQKRRCFVPPEFEQFARPVVKLAALPLAESHSSIDDELLAFARDVDDSNSPSAPGTPNPDENVNNHYDCAKDNRPEDGLIQSGDIKCSASISRSSSSYTTCSNASPSNKNSVDDIAARLSINKMSAENQVENGRQQLTVATLKRDKFVCNHCYRKERLGFNLRHRKFSARRLPHTRMSRYIETKVNEYIRENSPTSGEITVRVLTAYRDKVDVKEEMKSFLRQSRAKDNNSHPNLDRYPDSFEFTTRAIFAWQEIDGVDVCVFGMHVQEYGEDCPEPNKQVVYLSYLDSVHFFRPKQLRTAVYHEILLSYFKYVKKLGFRRVFIWVCPSRKGDDYIFYRHPSEQKMPTLKRLSDWYIHLLDKGVANGIVERHQNIYEYATTENWTSILSLPYLSGDYWPGEFERLLNIMIESQKKYDEKLIHCKLEDKEEETELGVASEDHDRSGYLLNDPSLDQHNVLSLSNLYQKASGIQKSAMTGKMLHLKNSNSCSASFQNNLQNTSIADDQEDGDVFSMSIDQDESKFYEPFTPTSTRSDEPLDLSKSTSAASPESIYDDDQNDVTWKEPISRKKRRKSSSNMGYTKKRSKVSQGKGRSGTNADVSSKTQSSQKSCRLKTSLRSCGDTIDTLVSPEEEMLRNLERSLKRQKEGFIVVRLSECDCSPHFESLRRKEETVFTCDLMRGREPFLQLARLNNYEFCTLRRAKFSSLAMVKHLSETFKLEPICNECFSFDSSKHHYACKHCYDYYLCTSCHENTHHEHPMSLLPASMQPDIDEFLQQCPPISAANSISSASSTISNKSFNETSPEIVAQPSTTPSINPELIIDNSIPLNRQMSNGLGATSSMPLGCKRQKNWALSLESRAEDEENAKFNLFTSNNKLSLSHRTSPPPSHSSNRNPTELDQTLIDNVIRQTEIDYNIDFDEMKGESKKLLSHYFACPIKDTCLRCKFVVMSCSFMSLLMRSSRMQMVMNCHPSDMPLPSNGTGNNNNNNTLASDGINLTTNRRFGK